MNILVTGGGGFLGRAIVALLIERKYSVRILGRSPQDDLQKLGVGVIRGSICDYPAVLKASKGIDAIIHVAAKAGVWGSLLSYYQPNVVGTENILKACKENHVTQLVYTSTPSVVSQKEDILQGDETLPYPRSFLCHYAQTKAIAEKKVLHANGPSLKTVALRPHLIWGTNDPHLIPQVLEKAKLGKLAIIGKGTNWVDFTHVHNAAWAHVLALEGLHKLPIAGKAYFISDDHPVQLWPWVEYLLSRLDYPKVAKRIPYPLGYYMGSACETYYKLTRRHDIPPMTRFMATQLAKSHYFSIKNAKNDLGYLPIIDHQEALEAFIESYGKNLAVKKH